MLPSWNGRQASSDGRSTTMTPRSTKWRTFSGVADTSVATTSTSSATPASSHILAVRSAALPDAHIATTLMHGPWKSCSIIRLVIGVDGMSWM